MRPATISFNCHLQAARQTVSILIHTRERAPIPLICCARPILPNAGVLPLIYRDWTWPRGYDMLLHFSSGIRDLSQAEAC